MKRTWIASLIVLSSQLAHSCPIPEFKYTEQNRPFFIRPSASQSLAAIKPYFSHLEEMANLTDEQLEKVKPADLANCNQEQMDQLYAVLSAGTIPKGQHMGTVIFAKGGSFEHVLEYMKKIANNATPERLGVLSQFLTSTRALKVLAEDLWKGKFFEEINKQRALRNMIRKEWAESLAIRSDAQLEEDKVMINGEEFWRLFPAKVYCGQSLLDSRRESIIIDYEFSGDFGSPIYHEWPDQLGGGEGLLIRDEIRMVRPGFYLGRAYMHRQFVLNFLLYNEEVAATSAKVSNDCWIGTAKDHKKRKWII